MYKIIAHRGYHNNKIKENTYTSIYKALNNNKIKGIEIDIRLTKDNKIVIIHDSLINRTSNGIGITEQMTLKELQKYNFGTNEKKETIPTLDKILDISTNKIILLEVKCNNNEKRFSKVLTKYLNKAKRNIYIISFNKKVLNLLKINYKKGLLSLTNKNTNKYNINMIHKLFYKQYNNNKETFIYTINKKEELKDKEAYYICDNLDEILKEDT